MVFKKKMDEQERKYDKMETVSFICSHQPHFPTIYKTNKQPRCSGFETCRKLEKYVVGNYGDMCGERKGTGVQ